MFQNISYAIVFGFPVMFYLGILTLISFSVTGAIGYMNYHRIHTIPFKWHPRMAALSFILAGIHAFLGIALYF